MFWPETPIGHPRGEEEIVLEAITAETVRELEMRS
jgi:hypothetical protein